MKKVFPIALFVSLSMSIGLSVSAQELVSAPSWWSDVHVCTVGKTPTSSVYIGVVGEPGTTARFVLRSDRDGNLPGYLEGKSGLLDKREMEVLPSDTVGYEDEYFERFRMPSGAVLTCTSSEKQSTQTAVEKPLKCAIYKTDSSQCETYAGDDTADDELELGRGMVLRRLHVAKP